MKTLKGQMPRCAWCGRGPITTRKRLHLGAISRRNKDRPNGDIRRDKLKDMVMGGLRDGVPSDRIEAKDSIRRMLPRCNKLRSLHQFLLLPKGMAKDRLLARDSLPTMFLFHLRLLL